MTFHRVAASLLVLSLAACASEHPNRDCVGSRFPDVTGKALDGTERRIPDGFAGSAAVVLVGYLQDAQFDADRWLFGLLQSQTPVDLVELPTIPGLFPRMAAGSIDAGMRKGTPLEDWPFVVTLYGSDAEVVARFTGDVNGQNIRVLLLDGEGVVRWFHDRGFSAGKLLELDRAARELAR